MAVKEEVEVALKEVLIPELAEIKKSLAELNAGLNEVIKKVGRIGRPLNDFDYIDDMRAAGLTNDQAYGIMKAKYELKGATKADLEETSLKVQGDLEAVKFNPKMAKAIVELIKDSLAGLAA